MLGLLDRATQLSERHVAVAAAKSALESAGSLPPAPKPRFALFSAVGAASLGVLFGTLDSVSLLLIAASATIGALVRRWLSGISRNPLLQPLCAALVTGAVAAVAGGLRVSNATGLLRRWLIDAGLLPVQRRDGPCRIGLTGPAAPVALLTSIAVSGTTALSIIIAMAFGLILPRLLYERLRPFAG